MKAKSKLLVLLLTLALLCGIFLLSASAAAPDLTKLATKKGATLTGDKTYGNSATTVGVDANGNRDNYYTKPLLDSDTASDSHDGRVYYYWHKTEGYSYLTLDVDFTTESYFPSGNGVDLYFLNRDIDAGWNNVEQFGVRISQPDPTKPTATIDVTPSSGTAVSFDATPFVWHHVTLVVKIDAEHNETSPYAITKDNSEMKLFLDGELVASKTSFLKAGSGCLDAMRVQSRVKVDGTTLCYDNLVANRYAVGDGTDLDALFTDGASGDTLDLNKTTYASLNYKTAPTIKKAVASVGGTYYASMEEAAAAMAEGDTLTLLADADIEITKPCTVNANGHTFTYRASALDIAVDGNVYTFTTATRVATVEFLDRNGATLSSTAYGVGATPAIPSYEEEYRAADGTLWYLSGIVAKIGETELSDFTAVTEEMLDQTVTVTPVYRQAAFAVTTDGVTTYYDTEGEEADSAKFLELVNTVATNTYLRLETDVAVAEGPGTIEFRNLAIDLDGHTLTYTGTGSYQFFNVRGSTFHLVSSRPGAKVASENAGIPLVTPFTSAKAYIGRGADGSAYADFDGDNISYRNIGIVNMQSDSVTATGGYFYYDEKGGNVITWPGGGGVTLINVKIYLAENFTGKLVAVAADNTGYSPALTMSGCTVYAAGEKASFCTVTKSLKSFRLTITDCDILGVPVMVDGSYADLTAMTVDEASRFTYLSQMANRDSLVAAGIPAETVTLDGFFDAEGNALTVSGIVSYALVEKTKALPVAWTVNGTVVLTDYWTVGATPFFTGASLTIPYVQDPANEDCVLAPNGEWEIGGVALSAITAEQLAAGAILTATPGLASVKKAFEVTTDGNTVYYIDTEYETFRVALVKLAEGAKVKVYTDYTDLPSGSYLQILVNDVELDVNGHTLHVKYKQNTVGGFIVADGTAYIYSSAPGGRISGGEDSSVGGGFVFIVNKGTLTLGRAKDGTTYDRANLTVDGTCLARVSTALVADSIKYKQTKGDNTGAIQFQAANATATVRNCEMVCMRAIFGMRAGSGWSATVDDSFLRLYSGFVSPHNDVKNNAANGFVFTNTVISTTAVQTNSEKQSVTFGAGVKIDMLHAIPVADGYVLARIDAEAATVVKEKVTLLYEVVPTADAVTVTVTGGTAELSKETWKKGSTPTDVRVDAFGTYYWYAKFATPVTEDTTLAATLKTTASKISGNLTLYANITFNLYFKKDGFITGVTYNGVTTIFTDADLDSTGEYYIFKISDIAPKDLADAFTLEVLLANGEETATYTVKTSLAKYASAVLASEESDEGKTLVLALLDYVREISVALGGKTADDAGIKAIDAGLKHYDYTRTEWTGSAATPTAGNITAASLHLASDPGFHFFLNHEKYGTVDEVTLTVNGVEKTYTVTHEDGENDYILVDSIHVSKYTDDLTVALDGETFTYNLGVYLAGFGETIPDYAHALYSYSLAANAYLAATAGN